MSLVLDAATEKKIATPQGEAPDAMPVHAYVNNGRWLARCPDCPRGCELISRDPRPSGKPARNRRDWFWCNSCQNASAGNRFRPIIWPSERFIEQMLAILAPRPEVNTNWLPGETLDFLRAENMEHGL